MRSKRLFLILCLAGVFGLVFFALSTPGLETSNIYSFDSLDETPPIIVIFTESTRADHVGPCYGYERETMPNVCDLSEDGVLFQEAHSQSSWTPAAMSTFFTSLSPNQAGLPDWAYHLSFDADTFTEELSESGYTVREGEGQTHLAEVGLLQGFDGKTDQIERDKDQFLDFYFYADHAHWPYFAEQEFRHWDNLSAETPAEIREKWETEPFENRTASKQTFVDLYNADMKQGDNEIGQIIQDLKDEGIYEESLIIYTSDHGQRFGEDSYLEDFTHQEPVAQHEGPADPALTHVPLVVKFPGNEYAGTEISEPVRLIDLGTTIIDYVGLREDFGIGKSVIPLIEGETQERTIFSVQHFGIENPGFRASLIEEDKVYQIEDAKRVCADETDVSNSVLYWRDKDPENPFITEDIGDRVNDSQMEENLREELCDAYTKGGWREYYYLPEEERMSENLEDQLRQLGYIE